jgi:bacillithiol biosynthesis deacetylase BshB1
MLDVLAIVAHRDDAEQTCGGTLLKLAEAGHATGILDLTAGEMGTRGTAEERAREAEEAARILQVRWRANLGLPDARVENTWENRLKLASRIREARPRLVILPYWEGRHPDHAAAGRLGYEACFLAGLQKLPLEGSPHRPRKIIYSALYYDVRPSFVVDISEQFERRVEALLAYHSQYDDQAEGSGLFPSHAEVRQRVEALARFYGMMVGVKFGEPFLLRETMLVSDPLAEICRGRPSI